MRGGGEVGDAEPVESRGSHHGPTSPQANHYLRWAFVEASNCVLMHRHRLTGHYVLALYDRIKARKCHGKAAVTLAHHLAESSWWILTKRKSYQQPHAHVAAMSSSKNG